MLAAMGTLNTRLEREQDIRLAIRVGIHTGLVVVGEMGGGGRQERLALGDTPNVASRIQGLAAPDTVTISAATYRLVQGYFVCQDLGVHALKGVTIPMPVYQVLGESGTRSRLEVAATRGLTPLVGREQEVALLLELWAHARDGTGQVAVLSGEAGIGKSRLVQVLKEQVGSEGATPIEFRCSPYHTNSALYPVIEHQAGVLRFTRDDSPAVKLDKLEQGLRPYPFPLEEVVSLFAALLSVPLLERYPPLTLTPQRQKQRTYEALVAWLLAETARQPVLAVWEDLHWADPSTLEALSLVIEQAPTARLLTLLTDRPEFHLPWSSRLPLTQLTLNRFGCAQIEAMIARITGGKALPTQVLEQMIARSDGVPHWQRAGQQALQRSANLEAVQHLTHGLALLATLPESPARAQQELDLQLALGPALAATKGGPASEMEQVYARARVLCTQIGETPQLVSALRGLWRFYYTRGELRTARELCEQLLQLDVHFTSPVPVYGLLGARASSPLLKQAGRLHSQGTGSAFTKQTSSRRSAPGAPGPRSACPAAATAGSSSWPRAAPRTWPAGGG
jgi:hypothetical protein